MKEIRHLRGDIDRRSGHRTHLRDAVRETRDHAGGGARHRGLRSRKRAEQIPQAKPFERVVVDQVERDLGIGGQPVIELRVHTRLLAVVVVVLRAIVPDVGGRGRRVLEIARRAEESNGLLAVENIQRHAEITLVAQHIEDFLIADIEQRVGPMLLAQRNLLGVGRSDARGKIIGDTPFFLHAQGGAALEIDRAAQRAGLLVGCMALGNLERFKHRTRHGVHARSAGHAALRAHQRAIDRDSVHRRRHAAHRETDDIALVTEIAGDTGQQHSELAGVHVGQITVGIECHDVLLVRRVPLRGQRRGVTLTLARDGEGGQLINSRGEVEIPGCALAGRHNHRGRECIKPQVGRHDLMGSGRNLPERKSAGLVGQSRQTQFGQLNLGAFQQATGAGVADVAGNRAGRGEHRRREGAKDKE